MLQVKNSNKSDLYRLVADDAKSNACAYLPDPMWHDIIEFCGPVDRAALASASRQLRRLTNEPRHWRSGTAQSDVQAGNLRDRWRVAIGGLSMLGRYQLRSAFIAAQAADRRAVEHALRNVDCDAAINRGPAPQVDGVWKSMLPNLLAAALQYAKNGEQAELADAQSEYAFAAERCGSDHRSEFFRVLRNACDKARLQKMLDEARHLAISGKGDSALEKIGEVENKWPVAKLEEMSGQSLKTIKELAHRANLCHMMQRIEGASYAPGSLNDIETTAASANAEVPSRVYAHVARKCSELLAEYPSLSSSRRMREHCLKILSQRNG